MELGPAVNVLVALTAGIVIEVSVVAAAAVSAAAKMHGQAAVMTAVVGFVPLIVAYASQTSVLEHLRWSYNPLAVQAPKDEQELVQEEDAFEDPAGAVSAPNQPPQLAS